MDFMTGTTSYALLKEKYSGFAAVTIRVTVDEVELTQKLGVALTNLTVELSSEFPASGCSFTVLNEYDAEKTDFKEKGAASLLQIGAKVELELGYIVTESVFLGYITEVTYLFGDEDGPSIYVECVDAKCLLMKSQRLEIMSERKLDQAVKALLSAQPVRTYLSGQEVSLTGAPEQMLDTPMENDYSFLVRHAQYSGCEFFILQGKAYFRTPPKAAAPLMTLKPGEGILTAKLSLRGTPLSKKVRVTGVSVGSDEAVSGSAQTQGKYSEGATASRMLGNTEKVFFDPQVLSAEDADKRARALLGEMENSFARLECTCIGIPEMIPGRWVQVAGLSKEANQTVYILSVRHVVTSSGFTTIFEARMDSL